MSSNCIYQTDYSVVAGTSYKARDGLDQFYGVSRKIRYQKNQLERGAQAFWRLYIIQVGYGTQNKNYWLVFEGLSFKNTEVLERRIKRCKGCI